MWLGISLCVSYDLRFFKLCSLLYFGFLGLRDGFGSRLRLLVVDGRIYQLHVAVAFCNPSTWDTCLQVILVRAGGVCRVDAVRCSGRSIVENQCAIPMTYLPSLRSSDTIWSPSSSMLAWGIM
jgi:hypothetical protein